MEDGSIDCLVLHGASPYHFEAMLHCSQTREERLIEWAFYNTYAGGGFDGTHYEIELFTDVSTYAYADKIHVHKTPAGRVFVCWIYPLRTKEAAIALFRAWCAGTVYTMVSGEDFAPLFVACKEDVQTLLKSLAKHSILVE